MPHGTFALTFTVDGAKLDRTMRALARAEERARALCERLPGTPPGSRPDARGERA